MRTLTLVALLSLSLGGFVYAQDTKNFTDKATRSRGNDGARDPNIKSENTVNKVNPDIPAPPSKGGTARAEYCQVHVDNRTNLIIKVFVDGTYRGLMGPWGDLYTYTLAGGTGLYARADYEDGTYSSWGPRVISCYGTETWTLHP
ncbi:MAG: hypothetical protein ABSE56_21605 [Bryobacteraceae bacterium]|jgi:hypothetical protein